MRYSPSARGTVSDLHALLAAVGHAKEVLSLPRRACIYRQGDRANSVFYLRQGRIKLCAISPGGREGIVAMLGPGDFFGEAGLLHRRARTASALCVTASEVVRMPRELVLAACRRSPEIAEAVLRQVLRRTAHYEDLLFHQLFSNSERRLAHVLLKLAGYNGDGKSRKDGVVRHISQAMLAEMVGTTRPRINGFMNKFRRLGHIDYDENRVRVYASLQQVMVENGVEDAMSAGAGR